MLPVLPAPPPALKAGTAWSRLDAGLLRIAGKDAVAYLQTKLTCDTRLLRRDGARYGFATNINGKVLVEGHYILDGADVLAVLPRVLVEPAIAHFDRYVIREDVALRDESEGRFVLLLTGEAAAAGARKALGIAGDDEAGWLRSGELRWAMLRAYPVVGALLCGPEAELPAVTAKLVELGLTEVSEAELSAWEVVQAVPRTPWELRPDETIPLEAGAFWGVSFNKGCYLGQEIIERLFSRGQAARRLLQLRWSGEGVPAGTPVLVGDDEVGSVTRCTHDGTHAVALAYIKRKHLPEPDVDAPEYRVGGNAVEYVSLVGGDGPRA